MEEQLRLKKLPYYYYYKNQNMYALPERVQNWMRSEVMRFNMIHVCIRGK